MSSLKRHAHPLHPAHNPKQPRLNGYAGGRPRPPPEPLAARWLNVGKTIVTLVGDTVANMVPSVSLGTWVEEIDSDSSNQLPSDALDSPTSSTPRQTSPSTPQSELISTPKTRAMSLDPFVEESPLQNISGRAASRALRPEDIPLPDSPTKPTHARTPSYPASTASSSAAGLPDQSTPRNRLPASSTPTRIPTTAPPSSSDSVLNHSIVPGMRGLHLGAQSQSQASGSTIDMSSQTASRQSSQGAAARRPLSRNARQREHIYLKVHKANVQRQRLEAREQIIRQLFEIKRMSGYQSGLKDLKGLLEFEHQLEGIIGVDDAPPTPRTSAPSARASLRGRRTRTLDNGFLQRALDKATATLNSPRPAKPFQPTLDQLKVSYRARDDEIERRLRPPVIPLPESLPPADEAAVQEILRRRGVVAKYAKEQVSQSDLARLRPGQWLNDEVINFYGALLLGRAEGGKENAAAASGKGKGKGKLLDIHYFSSFFWSKLVSDGYEKGRLAKWTKKIDIFAKDVVFMPVNHGNAHWTAAAINFRAKRFESYDSMGRAKSTVFKKLREYVRLEHVNKKKKEFDFTGWEDWAPDSTPQQENGFDCGVFTCQFMEALSRGAIFNFSQKDMPYLRRRMIWEIGNAKLRDDR